MQKDPFSINYMRTKPAKSVAIMLARLPAWVMGAEAPPMDMPPKLTGIPFSTVRNIWSILLGSPLLRVLLVLFLFLSIFNAIFLLIALIYLALRLYTGLPILSEIKRSGITIHFSDNILTVAYDDGSRKNFKISDIKKHNLNDPHKSKTLVFTDGTKLKNFDKLSHWVVLKDRLIYRT